MASKFFEQIKTAVIEREVEDVYNKGISLYFVEDIKHPFACDGLIETKTESGKMLKLIIEYKFDEMMTSKLARSKVIAQVLFYLKRFENDGMVLPNVCLIGDINECFCFHTNDILSYLDEDVDWSLAPSAAGNCTDLVLKLANDENLNPYIFDIDENFSFKEVAEKIKSLAENVQRYVRVTEHNISNIFDYFCKKVVKDVEKIQANDLVAIFMGVITDPDEYYQHPTKKNILVCKDSTQLSINGDGFKSFFSYFNRNYTPQEKNKFAEISDRLIEDTNRRNKGEFYTPTPFADYAHKYMESVFGENWKDEYVVWSCCCGTKNMTRDYYFKELYCSTLENAELQIGARYNKEATCFQMDFLNDGEDKMPASLIEAMKQNKPIIFFINPPYATAANNLGADGSDKGGCANTLIRKEMHSIGLGCGAENLQHQFLYRICKFQEKYNLTNLHIGLFSKPIYLSGGKQAKFLDYLCEHFSFNKGFLFNAGYFANCSDKWGITFNIWNTGKTTDKHNFVHKLVDYADEGIAEIGEKNIYNINGETTASDWAKEEIKKLKTFDEPNVSSAIKIRPSDSDTRGANFVGNFGYFLNAGNNVAMNAQKVGFFSTAYGNGNGHGFNETNFDKCTALFSARKLIVGNWINDKDEYLAPNTESEKWNEFVNDSIVYSLFHSSSNQSSLRQVEYKGKKWDIKNEFFFMSKGEIMELANEYHLDFTYNDAKVSSERFVYNKLQGLELSAEAKAVLDKAIELTKKSFKVRELFNDEHPEYQILNWDCGWYQIKGILKEFFPEDLKEFGELFKALADKMRPMVYELGFLK